jgi:hypothetical protein
MWVTFIQKKYGSVTVTGRTQWLRVGVWRSEPIRLSNRTYPHQFNSTHSDQILSLLQNRMSGFSLWSGLFKLDNCLIGG